MKITSFGEFKTFIDLVGLENENSVFADFMGCVSQYGLICRCEPNMKHSKGNACNSQYINIVNTELINFKQKIFSIIQEDQIEFLHDQHFFIGVLSR